jgi:ABC-type nickel/cobalt efflux system permease component RcnA
VERTDLREYATDAIKFWEPWRIVYNLALAAVVILYFALAYPSSKATITVDFCLGLFLMAVIANVAYCAAYVVDIFAQASGFRDVWRRARKILFIIGTLFAAIIVRFIAVGMFPNNR